MAPAVIWRRRDREGSTARVSARCTEGASGSRCLSTNRAMRYASVALPMPWRRRSARHAEYGRAMGSQQRGFRLAMPGTDQTFRGDV
jgi:hypothetical protein